MMDSVAHDLRHALRALARLRAPGVLALATLALGIGATTAMFGVVDAALLRPPPFVESDRLVMISQIRTTPREGTNRLRWSWPHIVELQRSASSFEAIASITGPVLSISGQGDPEQIDGEIVSPEYFQVMRAAPIAGRVFTADESARAEAVALVSARLWHRRFASDRGIVGQTVRLNDVPVTVIGILPEGFAGLTGKADVWISAPMSTHLAYTEYLVTPQHFISVVARLKDGVTIAQANADVASVGPSLGDAASLPGAQWGAAAVPVAQARIDATVRNSAVVLLGASVCVLVIACVNIASLLLARARMRRREIAIRLAIGSSRIRLVRLLLTEGLVMAAVAGAGGTILAGWGLSVFARIAPAVISTSRNDYGAFAAYAARLDGRVFLFALAVSVGTTALFALAPAWSGSRVDLTSAPKDEDRGSGRASRALGAFVVAETALAVLLLTGAGLLIDSFAKIQNRRTGFSTEKIVTFWVRPPTSRYDYPAGGPAIIERILTRIQAVPGVASAAVNRCTPFTGCSRTVAFLPGQPLDPTSAPGVGRHYISSDYFRTLGIPLVVGRALTPADRASAAPVAVVNEAGARRFWPGENPIGQHVWFGTTTGPFSVRERPVEIVGVVGDVKYEAVDQADDPSRADFYTSYLQFSYPDTMFLVKAAEGVSTAASLVPALRAAVASVDEGLPIFDVLRLDARIDAAVARPRFNATLLAAFAAAALLLSALGIYSVLSYAVSSRQREMGIRLALGANSTSVLALVLGGGLRLAVVGTAIGVVAAMGAARVLRSLLVGVGALGTSTLALAAGLLLVVAALAAFLPARRASLVDPAVVLRDE
jgi:putative ABC transport system permease protein